MIMFFISAALLVALCLSWLLYGLFRSDHSNTDQEAVNITLARERRQMLEQALADGSIDQDSFDYEKEQLEYDLAADLKLDSEKTATRKSGNVAAAVLVAIFVPVAAGALYLKLGNPGAINPPAAVQQAGSEQAPALTDLLPQLEARLASAPDDVNGWRLLGRSYLSVNEFANARNAFEKALALDENDVATLAQLSESIAMQRDGELAGEPLAYLERANGIDPGHEHTLWLLSIARQQTGDHTAALAGFDRLAELSQGNPDALATIDQMRSRSLDAMSSNGGSAAGTPESSATVQTDSNETFATGSDKPAIATTSIQVSVSLSAEAANAVAADNAVFIYARASEGPPMPLAVSRVTVGDLPLTVTLDDSMAMIPSMTLSAFPSVTIGARISASGNPLAQSGDWFSETQNILLSDTDSLSLNINELKP